MQTINHFSFAQYKLDQQIGKWRKKEKEVQKGSLTPKGWLPVHMILVYTRKCHISATKKN